MRRASQVWAIGHKARSTKLQAAATKRPNSAGSIYAPCMSSAGNIFTPCMISGPSARKTALDGKIPAPCIQNHPIAAGNGHMGRRCCHFYPKKHAWGENVASKGAYCAHSAKRERIRRDSCQMGPRSAAMQGRGARFYGAARWVTPLGRATRQVAAPTGWAWRARRDEDATLVGAGQARRWRAWRCGDATLAGSVAIASWHVIAWARAWRRWRAERDVGRRGGTAARGLTARRARWKRVTVGRERSGLTRRNTPTRVAAIRPNWQALPQRVLRALR